uniref:hypothetical protein n=1 Tax=Lentibacter algarum TaxID=576131 RepID=UPI0024906E68
GDHSVVLRATDGANAYVEQSFTVSVSNVNDNPTGAVTISGTGRQGSELTAASTLADPDGLGALSYQWKADGADISNATSSSLTLSQNEVGKEITVTVSYTDDGGTTESVTSAASSVVTNVDDAPTGDIITSGIATEDQTLTVSSTVADADGIDANTVSYQWYRNGSAISDATGTSYTLTQDDVGAAITAKQSYTDDFGNDHSVTSIATTAVSNVNDDPTGSVTISGTTSQGSELTAVTDALDDEDGLGDLSYQWLRDGSEINNATSSTYILIQNDVGSQISVRASYTDGSKTAEAVLSLPSSSVSNVNDDPTGSVTISGTATEDQTLNLSSTVADADGIDASTVSYQWYRDGSEISGATGTSYTLTQDDVGAPISVKQSYTDDFGNDHSVTSAATSAVSNVNDDPTGALTISGTAVEDQTLTGASTLADPDGLGALSYQWKADGADISNATDSTLTLSQTEVGKAITVTASYTDGGGTFESVTSAASSAVTNVNDGPTGSVTISGTAAEDQTLTLSSTVADADGIDANTVSYQWYRDSSEISGATDTSYTLTQDDVDAVITAQQTYTDNFGNAHSATSTATSAVSNVNDDPTGAVTISGAASQGSELTAVTDALDDEDGLGDLSYQWLRDGSEINNATSSTYILIQNDVGSQISVRASYTDGSKTAEAVLSLPSSSVSNVNDDPTGSVTISGTASQGIELTAVTATLADEDGLGALSYQWLRDGSEISNATSSTYTLIRDDVGAQISARVSYTDGHGNNESLTSTATPAVTELSQSADISLSGIVSSPDASTLDNITLTMSSDELPSDLTTTSGADGVFEFATEPLTSAVLTADKPIDKASEDAIGAYDALQALRLAVGLTKSDGTAEWHDYLAADINKDGRVGADDALDILKFAVGLTDGSSADWIFVDGDADWSGVDRRNTDYDEGVMLEDVLVDTSINMIGILVGDLDGSYVA